MYTSLYNVHRRVTIHVITLLISQSKHDVHDGLNQNVLSQGIYILIYIFQNDQKIYIKLEKIFH